MIPRYTRPDMGAVWSDQNKFQQWLEVELAAIRIARRTGRRPARRRRRLLRRHAAFDVARIFEIEKTTRHDVIAFTTAVAESMAAAGHAEASRWFHYGHDLERRRRYRPGAAAAPGVADSARRSRTAARRAEAPRLRVQARRADRPHPRRSCRAHHLRPETRHLVRGSRAAI